MDVVDLEERTLPFMFIAPVSGESQRGGVLLIVFGVSVAAEFVV